MIAKRSRKVSITGVGVASLCAARLLARNGFEVRIVAAGGASKERIISIALADISLAAAVFDEAPSKLFSGTLVNTRVLHWASQADAVRDPALITRQSDILDRLTGVVGRAKDVSIDTVPFEDAKWHIFASRPHTPALICPDRLCWFGERIHAGNRERPAELRAVDYGWTYSLPIDRYRDAVLHVAPNADVLRAADVSKQGGLPDGLSDNCIAIQNAEEFSAASPYITDPIWDHTDILISSAAMRFDPISGSGFGQAIRSALLLNAVINAASQGEPVDRVLDHYRRKLHSVFYQHIQSIIEHYGRARNEDLWHRDIYAMRRWLAQSKYHDLQLLQYALRNGSLIRLGGPDLTSLGS